MQDKMVYENKLKEWMNPVLKLGIQAEVINLTVSELKQKTSKTKS